MFKWKGEPEMTRKRGERAKGFKGKEKIEGINGHRIFVNGEV